jgi:DNA segregation ATPase FtsK/SpoIIIE, S-DNA-T family
MSAASKPHGTNNSHSTESDWDETITLIVMALVKGSAVLAWWSVGPGRWERRQAATGE